MKHMRNWLLFISFVIVIIIGSACANSDADSNVGNANNDNNHVANNGNNSSTNNNGNNGENDTNNDVNDGEPEEVTLLMQVDNEDAFEEQFKGPVEAALPHITLEGIRAHSGEPEELEEMLVSGNVPDIIYFGNQSRLSNFLDLDLVMDQEPLIERHNFDLSSIEPALVEGVRSYAPNGELYTLPIMRNSYILYYNKDIFDLFGVSYPDDGMMWDEVISLGRDVTGEVDGVQYHGLLTARPERIGDALDVIYVDPETDEPLHSTSEGIRRYMEIVEQVINIPGNVPDYLDDPIDHFYNDGRFVEGQVAMMTLYNHLGTLSHSDDELGFEYDFAVFPQFEDLPGIQPATKGNTMGVSAHSENPDAAFEVIQYVLSEEHQIFEAAERNRMSSLADHSINQEHYGSSFPHLADKNMDALYALTPTAGPERRSRYDEMSVFAQDMVTGLLEGNDINTVLREVEEMAAQAIANAKEME